MSVAKKFYHYDLTRENSGYKPDFKFDLQCEKSFLKGGRYGILTSILIKIKIMIT